jgi:DNA-directed RNA polymerase beta' subunit
MKEGMIRSSILGKTIEFSARAVVCVDPSLTAHEIRVSKKILKRLWMPYFLHYLTAVKGLDYSFCFDHIMLKENENSEQINHYFDEFLNWFCEETP